MISSWRCVTTILGTVVLSVGCAAKKELLVQLETHRPQAYDPHQVEVQAMVLGPQTGLHYKWFSVNGDFDPQESYEPKSQFTFAPSSVRDRIWVEVWRDNEKVAESALDVNVESRRRSSVEKTAVPEIAITRSAISGGGRPGHARHDRRHGSHISCRRLSRRRLCACRRVVHPADAVRDAANRERQYLADLDPYRFELRGACRSADL